MRKDSVDQMLQQKVEPRQKEKVEAGLSHYVCDHSDVQMLHLELEQVSQILIRYLPLLMES